MDMNDNAPNQAEKRAHHNALERKRRDHIKGSFGDLRDVIPLLKGEKVNGAVSRFALGDKRLVVVGISRTYSQIGHGLRSQR